MNVQINWLEKLSAFKPGVFIFTSPFGDPVSSPSPLRVPQGFPFLPFHALLTPKASLTKQRLRRRPSLILPSVGALFPVFRVAHVTSLLGYCALNQFWLYAKGLAIKALSYVFLDCVHSPSAGSRNELLRENTCNLVSAVCEGRVFEVPSHTLL